MLIKSSYNYREVFCTIQAEVKLQLILQPSHL